MDSFGDYDWVAWFGLAVLFGIIEVTTLDLVFAMLATGALAAGVTGILTDSAPLQILVFLVVSVAMLAVVTAAGTQATCAPPSRSAPASRP